MDGNIDKVAEAPYPIGVPAPLPLLAPFPRVRAGRVSVAGQERSGRVSHPVPARWGEEGEGSR